MHTSDWLEAWWTVAIIWTETKRSQWHQGCMVLQLCLICDYSMLAMAVEVWTQSHAYHWVQSEWACTSHVHQTQGLACTYCTHHEWTYWCFVKETFSCQLILEKNISVVIHAPNSLEHACNIKESNPRVQACQRNLCKPRGLTFQVLSFFAPRCYVTDLLFPAYCNVSTQREGAYSHI